MSGTSGPSDSLGERLRKKREEQEREIERANERHLTRIEQLNGRLLQQLEQRLSARFSAAASTIERDTAAAARRLSAMLLRAWARPLAAGVAILAGLSLGGWGLAQWQWRQIRGRIETKAGLELDIEESRRTLRELEERALGVRIAERANGTFVVLPPGAETGWTVGGRAAVKLPD